MLYDLVAFDLDDTLAPSKGSLPTEVAEALRDLLQRVPVCVISGGNFDQFRSQLLAGLEAPDVLLTDLHLMPTCGTRYMRYESGQWVEKYAHNLTDEQKSRAIHSLRTHAEKLGLNEKRTWGPVIEDRLSQITFSALGQQAPIEAKRAWDPAGEKKHALAKAVAVDVPDLEVRSGGSTSVDITARGVDKAYGMSKLVEVTRIAKERMLFVGDRLDPSGNDYPVRAAGWPTIEVAGWEETPAVIAQIIAE